MNDKELLLIAKLLDLSFDKFSRAGCNDLPDEIWSGWSDDERRKLISEFYIHNQEPEESEEGDIDIEDFVLMGWMAERIRKTIEH